LGALTEDQKEVLRRMQHSTKRISRMASDMFELSVGRHVKKQLDLRRGDVRECIQQALHEITPIADSKSITISTDLDAAPGALYFEAGQIEQAVINLLDNACKFTPKAGTIDIQGYPFFWERRGVRNSPSPSDERRYQAGRNLNAYRIDIRNSGAFIPREHLPNIFEEYTSYAGGRDRSGGGLGLAICRMIATLHDGRVWAENTDRGPMFSFVLPVQPEETRILDVSQKQLLHFSEA
jgi:signal transduction histidine kinase